MPTQTGSIDFKSTKGFQSYASGQYTTKQQAQQMQAAIEQNAGNIAARVTKTEFENLEIGGAGRWYATHPRPIDEVELGYQGADKYVTLEQQEDFGRDFAIRVDFTPSEISSRYCLASNYDTKPNVGIELTASYGIRVYSQSGGTTNTITDRTVGTATVGVLNTFVLWWDHTSKEFTWLHKCNGVSNSGSYKPSVSSSDGYTGKSTKTWIRLGADERVNNTWNTKYMQADEPAIWYSDIDSAEDYLCYWDLSQTVKGNPSDVSEVICVSSAKSFAELAITADGINSTVSKITSAMYVNSKTASWPLASLKTYAAEGHSENWNVVSTDGLRVGDTVYVKGTDGTRACTVYIKTTVTAINSTTSFTGTSHGYEDVLPVESIKSTINQSSDSVKIQARHVEIDGEAIFSSIKDDVANQTALEHSGSGTSIAMDDAATASLKSLTIYGKSVQDGTPTPSAPKPIYSVCSPNMVSNSDVMLVSTYGSKTDSTSCVLTRTIPKGTMVTVSCRIEATNVTWAGSGSRRAGVEINQPTDGTSSGTQYVGVWWGISGSNHQGSDANFSGTISAIVTLTRDFVANGSRTLGVYIQNMTGGSITVSEPSLTVGFFKPYVPSGSIGLLVNGRNMLRLASAGRYTNVAANGITWTMNDDGTVSAKGTSTGISQVYWSFGSDDLPAFDGMELSGCPSVSGCSLRLEKDTSPYTAYAVDTGNGATVSIPSSVSGDAYLFCRVDSGKTVDVTFRPMIRRPSQPNDYEPYRGTVVPIPMNGHQLRSLPDGTRDELTVDTDGHVTMTQRVEQYVFDGSKTWTTWANGKSYYSPIASGGGYVVESALSDHFGYTVGNQTPQVGHFIFNRYSNTDLRWNKNVSFNYDNAADLSNFKTWVTSNPITVLYPLATPQTIDLGTIDMPQVKDGDTVEVIAALSPSIDVTWFSSAGQSVADIQSNVTIIDGARIRTGSIVAEKLASGTITSDQIAAGAISADRLDANALTVGNIAGLEDQLETITNGISSLSNSTQWVHFQDDVGTVFGEAGSANNVTVKADGVYFNTEGGEAARASAGIFYSNEMRANDSISTPILKMGNWALVQSGTTFSIEYLG